MGFVYLHQKNYWGYAIWRKGIELETSELCTWVLYCPLYQVKLKSLRCASCYIRGCQSVQLNHQHHLSKCPDETKTSHDNYCMYVPRPVVRVLSRCQYTSTVSSSFGFTRDAYIVCWLEKVFLLLQALTDQQQFGKADEMYDKCIDLEPDNATTYVHKGYVWSHCL